MRRGPPITFICLAFAFSGCSSTLVVKSDPGGAEVAIRVPGAESPTKIGITPIEISDNEIQKLIGSDPTSEDTFELVVSKPDYQKHVIAVPASRLGVLSTTVSVKLHPGSDEGHVANQLVQYLLNAQKLANEGAFDRAHVEIDRALAVEPKFARAISMRGAIFFLQKNYRASLDAYEKAIALEPQMTEAIKMVGRLRTLIENRTTP